MHVWTGSLAQHHAFPVGTLSGYMCNQNLPQLTRKGWQACSGLLHYTWYRIDGVAYGCYFCRFICCTTVPSWLPPPTEVLFLLLSHCLWIGVSGLHLPLTVTLLPGLLTYLWPLPLTLVGCFSSQLSAMLPQNSTKAYK